jgi:uncharacterized membrane protein
MLFLTLLLIALSQVFRLASLNIKTISTNHHQSQQRIAAMTQTSKRRLILAAIVLFALIVFGVLYIAHHKSRASHAPAATQSQIDALNDALKNGLITKPQYDSEIKKLKDQPQSQPTPQSLP